MAKSKGTRKAVPTGKKLGRPKKEQPVQDPEAHVNQWNANDQVEPEIGMPVTLNDLHLLALALQSYRLEIKRSWVAEAHVTKVVLNAVQKLESKIESNEESWQSLYGGKLSKQG